MTELIYVMYVEDDDATRFAAPLFLRQKVKEITGIPAEVKVFATFKEARAVVFNTEFDVIISDNDGPGGESGEQGHDFLVEMRKHFPKLPLFLLTANEDTDLKIRTHMKKHTIGFIHKLHLHGAVEAADSELVMALRDIKRKKVR